MTLAIPITRLRSLGGDIIADPQALQGATAFSVPGSAHTTTSTSFVSLLTGSFTLATSMQLVTAVEYAIQSAVIQSKWALRLVLTSGFGTVMGASSNSVNTPGIVGGSFFARQAFNPGVYTLTLQWLSENGNVISCSPNVDIGEYANVSLFGVLY